MKDPYRKALWIAIGAIIGLFAWTANNVIATQNATNDTLNTKFNKVEDQISELTKNISIMQGNIGQISLPALSATMQSIDGRTSRIEAKLNLTP